MADLLSSPRKVEYDGTEDKDWSEVEKDFNGFLKAWYEHQGQEMPNEPPHAFNACTDDCKEWMSKHSVLGNPEAKTFAKGVKLPIKNPHTGKLNKHAVRSANAYAEKVTGVSDSTIEEVKKYLEELYDKEFED